MMTEGMTEKARELGRLIGQTDEYKAMNRVSMDYGIMEKLTDILVIPGNFGWSDIGSWATVAEPCGRWSASFSWVFRTITSSCCRSGAPSSAKG